MTTVTRLPAITVTPSNAWSIDLVVDGAAVVLTADAITITHPGADTETLPWSELVGLLADLAADDRPTHAETVRNRLAGRPGFTLLPGPLPPHLHSRQATRVATMTYPTAKARPVIYPDDYSIAEAD